MQAAAQRMMFGASENFVRMKHRIDNQSLRKILFKPKHYEAWKEGDLGDEIEERDRLLREIEKKEKQLMAKKSKNEAQSLHEYSDDEDEQQVVRALEKLKSQQQREEEYKHKLIEMNRKLEEIRKAEEEDRYYSEMKNPSAYGWFYTDGYYGVMPFIGVEPDLVKKFNQDQADWWKKWWKRYPETFTSKFKRFFWPPKLLLCKTMFRTRGSYLDFAEVRADPPRLDVNVNFERDPTEYIANTDERLHYYYDLSSDESTRSRSSESESSLVASKKPRDGYQYGDPNDPGSWYYDDDEGLFLMKRLGFEIYYYYDSVNSCWRHKSKRGKYKSENQQTPYDFYFDDSTGQFVAQEEYKGKEEIVYDPKSGVYRIRVFTRQGRLDKMKEKYGGVLPFPTDSEVSDSDIGFNYAQPRIRVDLMQPNQTKTKRPSAFFFDEEYGRWLPKDPGGDMEPMDSDVSKEPKDSDAGKEPKDSDGGKERKKKKRKRPELGKEPKDSDGGKEPKDSDGKEPKDSDGGKEPKDSGGAKDFQFDENGRRYTRKFEGPWRGMTGFSPDDYFWSDRTSKFLPKPPRQGDNFKYYPKDGVWRREEDTLTSNSTVNFRSNDIFRFYFDEEEGQFKPKDLSESSHFRYLRGRYSKIWKKVAIPKSNLWPEDWYWDTYKRRWYPRPTRMDLLRSAQIARYILINRDDSGWFFQTGGPDTVKGDYFFDFIEGHYFRKLPNEQYVYDEENKCDILSTQVDRPKLKRYVHDFYFDPDEGEFFLKERKRDYVYDTTLHIWKKGRGEIKNLAPDKFHFDVDKEMFVKGVGATYDPMSMLHIKPGSGGGTKNPDHFYYNESEGKFYPKNAKVSDTYEYDPLSGAWKMKNAPPFEKTKRTHQRSPRNFYYDDTEQQFKLKVAARPADYYFDSGNNVFRHVVASGKTKSGYRPKDFSWNNDFRAFIPNPMLRKGKVVLVGNLPKWEPLREYKKPWLTPGIQRKIEVENPDRKKSWFKRQRRIRPEDEVLEVEDAAPSSSGTELRERESAKRKGNEKKKKKKKKKKMKKGESETETTTDGN